MAYIPQDQVKNEIKKGNRTLEQVVDYLKLVALHLQTVTGDEATTQDAKDI